MSYANRKFGHCRVTWVIETCCAHPFEDNWEVMSPVFLVDGHVQTKWRMSLKYNPNSPQNMYFHLTRLKHRDGKGLWIHYKLYHFTDEEHRRVVGEYQKMMHPDTDYVEEMNLFDLNDNSIKLDFQIIVWMNIVEPINDCVNAHLRQLSKDMDTIYNAEEDYGYDMQIKTKHPDAFRVHKIIMCQRVKALGLLDEFKRETCVYCDGATFDSMDKVVRFLYTADMAQAVRSPQLQTYDLAKEFNAQPIISYYEPEILNVHTATQLESFIISWEIEDFLSREERLLTSHAVSGELYHGVLKIFPDVENTRGYVKITAEINLDVKRKVCVELFMEADEEYSVKKTHGECDHLTSFMFQARIGEGLLPLFPENGCITLRLQVHMTMCMEESSMEGSITTRKPYCDQQNYIDLSRDMLSVYRSADFHDLKTSLSHRIQDLISTHGFILRARNNDFFRTVFDDPGRNVLEQIKSETVDQLLQFLISGEFSNALDYKDVIYLCDIAEECEFDILRHALVDNLNKYLSEMLGEVLEFASSKNITDLLVTMKNVLDNINL